MFALVKFRSDERSDVGLSCVRFRRATWFGRLISYEHNQVRISTMPRGYSVLAPALSPNSVLDLSIPVSSGSTNKKDLSEVSVVRHYDLKNYVRNEEAQAPLGIVKRVAVGQGSGGDADEQIVSS